MHRLDRQLAFNQISMHWLDSTYDNQSSQCIIREDNASPRQAARIQLDQHALAGQYLGQPEQPMHHQTMHRLDSYALILIYTNVENTLHVVTAGSYVTKLHRKRLTGDAKQMYHLYFKNLMKSRPTQPRT
jgi:hypothetical protein